MDMNNTAILSQTTRLQCFLYADILVHNSAGWLVIGDRLAALICVTSANVIGSFCIVSQALIGSKYLSPYGVWYRLQRCAMWPQR